MKRKMTPLEELQYEKMILRDECRISEERLNDTLAYIRENAASIVLKTIFRDILQQFGLGGSSTNHNNETSHQEKTEKHSGIFQSILSSLSIASPIVWDIVKPMLIKFALSKLKSIFIKDNKHKR